MNSQPASPIPGYFGHDEVGFVCDLKFTNARLDGATTVAFNDFGELLLQSGKLPALGKAPVSAWVLARLAALSSGRFPFRRGQVCGSDTYDYWIQFLTFTVGEKLTPTGMVSVLGGRSAVKLHVHTTAPHTPGQIRDALTAALLAAPTTLNSCKIVVVCTAFENPNHWRRVPYTLGWDGSAFIFHDSPEHTASAEDEDEE